MTAAPPKNAIQRRIDLLAEIWSEFTANPEARVLRLMIDTDSARLVDLFLELQNEEVSDIPDLFMRFREPFEQAQRYGFALRESLVAQYEEIREGIAEEGIEAGWSPPGVMPGETDIVSFVKACVSLREYYDAIMDHLVAVLTPVEIADSAAWLEWLNRLMRSEVPEGVRFLVVDNATRPSLDDLSARHPERLVTIQPQLDMPGAYAELVRNVPGSGPGFAFRRLFVALSNAAAAGNLVVAQRTADQALQIATRQNWPQMQTVVYMTLGAAYFAAGEFAATRNAYRSANAAIAGSGDPAAPKLDIQTRFAEASVSVGEQKYEEAAHLYEQIAPLAEEQQEHFALLESRRMAAYCYQAAGRYEEAWQAGQQALAAGALLEDDVRKNSTLPYVGQGLLQLIEGGHVKGRQDDIRRRLEELVGEDWESKLQQGAAAS